MGIEAIRPSLSLPYIDGLRASFERAVASSKATFGIDVVATRVGKEGYLVKTKKKGNDKEIILELTPKGWKAFRCHEESLESAMTGMPVPPV